MMLLLVCLMDERIPQTKAEEAEKDSFEGQMNSCMQPSGNWLKGKALANGCSAAGASRLFRGTLKR